MAGEIIWKWLMVIGFVQKQFGEFAHFDFAVEAPL